MFFGIFPGLWCLPSSTYHHKLQYWIFIFKDFRKRIIPGSWKYLYVLRQDRISGQAWYSRGIGYYVGESGMHALMICIAISCFATRRRKCSTTNFKHGISIADYRQPERGECYRRLYVEFPCFKLRKLHCRIKLRYQFWPLLMLNEQRTKRLKLKWGHP